MRIVVAAATDIGHVREGNEDTYLVQDPLFVVADGMGGHLGGEVASRLAVETIERLFEAGEGTLAEQISEANRAVFERSVLDRSVAGMGTTLTAALHEDDRLHLAHVGDSRAYLFRAGRLRQLTQDHTLVQRMVEEGELTPDQAEDHPHRNILTRVLGVDPTVDVDELDVPLEIGDRVIICSDGLTGMVPDDRIAEILADEPDAGAAVRRLLAEANDAGGVDNITAVLLDAIEGEGPALAARSRSETAAGLRGGGGTRSAGDEPRSAGPPPPSRSARPRWGRVAVIAGVSVAVLVVGVVGFRVYLDSQWYVGVSDGRVAIFRGIPAEVAGFELHSVVVETTIPAAEAQALALYRELDEGITADDRASADAIVEQIRDDVARARGLIPEGQP